MNYAVIGTGYWGSNHVRVATELMDSGIIDSVILCDIDEERVASLASSYDVTYTTDYHELPSMGVDAATVATPSPTHSEVAETLLAGGVDLLVEKPLAVSSDAAWSIVDHAREHDRTLGVGHIFRYHPALHELKDRINRGELGEIKYLNTNRFSFREPRKTTGVLYSLAVHDVDIYTYLLNKEPNSMYCKLDSFVREDIDETATIVMDFDDTTGIINESWQVPVFGKRRDLTVVGTERTAHIDYLEDTVLELYDATVRRSGDSLQTAVNGSQRYEVKRREPLKVEIKSFVEACLQESTPRASGAVGAKAVELLELARESADRDEVVDL